MPGDLADTFIEIAGESSDGPSSFDYFRRRIRWLLPAVIGIVAFAVVLVGGWTLFPSAFLPVLAVAVCAGVIATWLSVVLLPRRGVEPPEDR